jgi:hypothetical protein
VLGREIPDWAVAAAVGVLVLLSPAVILLITLEFLVLSGDLVVGRVTPLELLELYLLDLAVLVGFAYLVYRLVRGALPRGLSASREANADDEADDATGTDEE